MPTVIHAHDLLDLLIKAAAPVPRETLRSLVHERFGEEVLFASCSENNYSFDEILQFLASRDKIIISDNGIVADIEKICDH